MCCTTDSECVSKILNGVQNSESDARVLNGLTGMRIPIRSPEVKHYDQKTLLEPGSGAFLTPRIRDSE
jgi:hypothetical protein